MDDPIPAVQASQSPDVLDSLLKKPTSSPEWLAMAAYGLLIYLSLSKDTSLRTLSTVSGYSLLFFSKYLKGQHIPDYRTLQTWGYVFVTMGLNFSKWRDAFAVLAYGLSIAQVEEARHLISMVLALKLQDGGGLGMTSALLALIAYHI